MGWRDKKFAVALTCADWRLHQPGAKLYQQLCRALRANALFLNAAPGPDGLLDTGRTVEWAAVVQGTKLLAARPGVRALGIVAHQDCIAHAVTNEKHETDVRRLAEVLKQAVAFDGRVSAFVAIRHTDAKWRLKEVARL